MTNAEKFKKVFGKYATEIWAMPEDEYLNWINSYYIGEDIEPSEKQLSKARAEGAEEAWEFVPATDEWDEDIRCYDTYAEAKAEFEKWKAGQKWKPKVGDVVMQNKHTGVVLDSPDGAVDVYVLWKDCGPFWEVAENLTPTGKHFDLNPIFEVLK